MNFYNPLWLAGIYAVDYLPESSSVRAILRPVRNTAEGVRSTSIMMVCFVHAENGIKSYAQCKTRQRKTKTKSAFKDGALTKIDQ